MVALFDLFLSGFAYAAGIIDNVTSWLY